MNPQIGHAETQTEWSIVHWPSVTRNTAQLKWVMYRTLSRYDKQPNMQGCRHKVYVASFVLQSGRNVTHLGKKVMIFFQVSVQVHPDP